MKISLAVVQALSLLFATISVAAEPVAPKRIDGGVLVPTMDSVKDLITACVPIKIVVSFIILEDGTTAELRVIEALPDGVDISVAIDAVAQFQYEPIIVDGVAVKSGIQTQATIYDPADDPNCDAVENTDTPPNKALQLLSGRACHDSCVRNKYARYLAQVS